jgi:hypothetical protein
LVGDDQVDAGLDRLVDHRGGRVDGEHDRAHGLVGVAADKADGVPVIRESRVVPGVQGRDDLAEGDAGHRELPDRRRRVLVHREGHEFGL